MNTSINIVNLKYVENVDEWLRDDNNVYIGRVVTRVAQACCKWGNPFKLRDYGYNRSKVVNLYESYVCHSKELADSVWELKGKVLGCWCAPNQCHGEILHHLAGNRPVYGHISVEATMDIETVAIADHTSLLDDELSETIPGYFDSQSSSQDGNTILRSRPLSEDINAGSFDVLLQPSKRTQKNRLLKHEQFDFSIYVQKQCGFLTDRPLFWMKKIDNYIHMLVEIVYVIHMLISKF